MDWTAVWQMGIPLLVYILGQVIVYLKAQQATTHAQNAADQSTKAAQHAAMSHDAAVRQGGRLAALEQAIQAMQK